MKWLPHFIPLPTLLLPPLMMVIGSCSSTTNTTVVNPVEPTNTPIITGFSPDTVWTLKTLTIHGSNFGYDAAYIRVTIDTAVAQVIDDEDTMVKVIVPEGARTGRVHVWAYEQTAASVSQVVIKYTFNPHSINDSVPTGGMFTIPGTGMNNYHGILRLYVNGIIFPIDSIFPDRIVSNVIANGTTGQIDIYDADSAYAVGTLTVIRSCAWTTLSEIWDNLSVRETHHRIGFTNSNQIDSTWETFATYFRQVDTSIFGTFFSKVGQELEYTLIQPNQDNYYPLLQLTWDTVNQATRVGFNKVSYLPTTPYHSGDTDWWYDFSIGTTVPAPLPVDGDVEFALPISNFVCYITEDSTDSQGLTNWQETTTGTVISGSFDLILKR